MRRAKGGLLLVQASIDLEGCFHAQSTDTTSVSRAKRARSLQVSPDLEWLFRAQSTDTAAIGEQDRQEPPRVAIMLAFRPQRHRMKQRANGSNRRRPELACRHPNIAEGDGIAEIVLGYPRDRRRPRRDA